MGLALHRQMAVDAEDERDHLLAKAIEDGKRDDKHSNAEEYADEGKTGDHGYETFLTPRAQIAHRDHTLEGRECHALPPIRRDARARSRGRAPGAPRFGAI